MCNKECLTKAGIGLCGLTRWQALVSELQQKIKKELLTSAKQVSFDVLRLGECKQQPIGIPMSCGPTVFVSLRSTFTTS